MLIAAARGDQVHRHIVPCERPQPRLLTVDPPPGLVGRDRRACADPVDQRLIRRRKHPGLTSDSADDTASGDLKSPTGPAPLRSSAVRAPAPCSARSPARPRASRACTLPPPTRPTSEMGDGPDGGARKTHTCRYAPRTGGATPAAAPAHPDTETRPGPRLSSRHTHTAPQAARRVAHQPRPAARDEHADRDHHPTGAPTGEPAAWTPHGRTAPLSASPPAAPPPAAPQA